MLLQLEQHFVRLALYQWSFPRRPGDDVVTQYPESPLASRNASL
jgi:hypothetical protein